MIEVTTLKYLTSKLSIPAYMEYPEEEIDEFLVLDKTGSSRLNGIQSASLAIQSHGKTLQKAAELNYKVIDAMDNFADEVDSICFVELNSDYEYTDEATKHYRYQAIFEIKYC